MKPSAIFTKKIMSIDLRVWQTMLITIVTIAIFGIVKYAFFSSCANLNILVNNLDITASKYLYANKPVTFKIDSKDTSIQVLWRFSKDGVAVEEKGNPLTHVFKEPGQYEVVAFVNKTCKVKIKLLLEQSLTSDNFGSTSTGGNPINGLDQVTSAQSVSYFCDISATTYLWKVVEDPSIQTSSSNMFNPVFLNPGLYTIELTLNNDPSKVYKKSVLVSTTSSMQNMGNLLADGSAGPAPVVPISPNVTPPNNTNFNQTQDKNNTEEEVEENETVEEVKKKKVPLYIPDQELKYQLSQIGDKKASILDLKPYFCDGYESNTKVQLDGKIISLTDLCDKLQSKKGILRGKPKLESVKTARDPESKCILVIYVEIK